MAKHKLEKVLGFKTILLITINSIMGTGIFFLPAVGARHAGPASLLSWLILSIISIYIAMCFAELTSMFPKSGGIYEFCKQAYGRFPSFIIGWTTFIAGNITMAMLIVGAIHYLLPVPLTSIKILLSLAFIIAFNYMAYKGMKTSATMLITFGFITLFTLLSLLIPGLFRFEVSDMTPFFVFPLSSVFITIFFIAETFFGWETSTFLAGETKDGKRVMPKVLILGTIIIAIISILFVIAGLSTIPWQEFGTMTAPLASLSTVLYGEYARNIFTILVYLSIIGSVAGWVVSAPRLLLSMAEDKLFISQLAHVHPKYKTPHKAILFQTIITIALIIIGSGSYTTLLELLVPLVLLMYSAVLVSLTVLRFKKPNLKRYYRAPFGKTLPVIVAILGIVLLILWSVYSHAGTKILWLGISFIILGLPLYFLLETYYDPKMIVRINNSLAFLSLLTERISFPKHAQKKFMDLVGNLKDKTVLEYGCNVGTLTLDLAETVGFNGKIYATGSSKKSLRIVQKRIDKHNHKQVDVLHHRPEQMHPKINKVDAIVSAGIMSNLQNEKRVLKKMNNKLNMGGKVVFLDYDMFFKFIPNVEWLNKDKTIKAIFLSCGFKVEVERKKGFLWEYLYIYGSKVKNI